MKHTKKLLSLLLVLCLILSLSCTAFAADEAKPLTGKTVILHSNDVHGAIDLYADMASLKADYEAQGAEVILIQKAPELSMASCGYPYYVSGDVTDRVIDMAGTTGWTGGTGGSQLGTTPAGALPESKTWQPPVATGIDLMGGANS